MLVRPEDLPKFFGCRIKWSRRYDGPALKLPYCLIPTTCPLGADSLATREEFECWLQRVIIRILSPPPPSPRLGYIVFMSSTLRTFIDLLIHAKKLGYPSHWISDFLEHIAEDKLESRHRPYSSFLPMSVSHITHIHPRRKMQLSPWMADIEVVVVMAAASLPFAVRLPRHFPGLDEISTFCAEVGDIVGADGRDFAGYARAPALAVLFVAKGLNPDESAVCSRSVMFSDDVDVGGKRQFMLSVKKLDVDRDTARGKVSWPMCVARVDKMKAEGWSLCLWRTDSAVAGEWLPSCVEQLYFAEIYCFIEN
jgi:hypothetical protein